MSIKIEEYCPKCSTPTAPTDDVVRITSKRLRLRFWRYECQTCRWVWANELQRKHNDHEYDTGYKLQHSPNGWA